MTVRYDGFDDLIARLDQSFNLEEPGLKQALVNALREACAVGLSSGPQTMNSDEAALRPEDEIQVASSEGFPPAMVLSHTSTYEDVGLIGQGGMGEVRRVRDRNLHRTMAMKVIREEYRRWPEVLNRFIAEAQATAQLQHPGIVPVYDLGILPDGRYYFTMREVRGRTMGEIIRRVHASSRRGRWESTESGWTLRRLIDAFHQVCEAVAYAHSRGVVHRDLKPDNVMLGEYGEVQVMDWGLALVDGTRDVSEPQVITGRTEDGQCATGQGGVVGTPAYMPPEQAGLSDHRVGPRADVYSLGATLYHILSGKPPFPGLTGLQVIARLEEGPPTPLLSKEEGGERPLPQGIVEIMERAMDRDPERRFSDAKPMAAALADWLAGARKRDQAKDMVALAEQLRPEAESLRERARQMRREGRTLQGSLPVWATEDEKQQAWELLDEGQRLAQRAEQKEDELIQCLQAALAMDPELEEANAVLCQVYAEEHRQAEAATNPEAASRAETQLRSHLGRLRPDHAVREALLAYLSGEARFTLLVPDDDDLDLELFRVRPRGRRLRAEFDRILPPGPHHQAPIPIGSWILHIARENEPDVRYPMKLDRQGHWHGVPPRQDESAPIPLPTGLGEQDIYVAPGWFVAGPRGAEERRWCEAFVIRRFVVRCREYAAFIDDLVAHGRGDEAQAWLPRRDSQRAERIGDSFRLGSDWLAESPVRFIALDAAQAFAQWEADRTGRPWRLPRADEWEKAARGVDGRRFPWGDHIDPTWAGILPCHPALREPTIEATFDVDESPYGVRHMAGNVLEWTEDVMGESSVVCGGAWDRPANPDGVAARSAAEPDRGSATIGVRLVRSLVPEDLTED